MALPVPPRQNDPWIAETPLQKVAAQVFDLGIADPRGCEYREVDLLLSDPTAHQSELRTVHAWLLPQGYEGRRFAVAWNGLVYLVHRVGDPTSLAEDLKAPMRSVGFESDPTALEAIAAHQNWLTPIKAILLWRLGADKAAEQLWEQVNFFGHNPYQVMAGSWASCLYQRAVGAYLRGDDRLACADAHTLFRIAPLIDAELTRLKVPPPDPYRGKFCTYLRFLDQVPQLLLDSNRRLATGKRPSPRSIEALIQDLENIEFPQWQHPYGFSLPEAAQVQALVARGDEAVGPLIEVMASDRRLTRTASRKDPQLPDWHLVPVSEAADIVISLITHIRFPLYNPKTGREYTHPEKAELIRAYWNQNGHLPMAERWYRTLLDDHATTEDWIQAADNIVRPKGQKILNGRLVDPPPGPDGKIILLGEPLRSRRNPSVSEILGRRSDGAVSNDPDISLQTSSLNAAAELAVNLQLWDSAAARPILLRRLKQLTQTVRIPLKPGYFGYHDDLNWNVIRVMEPLAQNDDGAAWKTFAQWMRHYDKTDFSDRYDMLRLASQGQKHPAVAAALDWVFNDPQGAFYELSTPQDLSPNVHHLREYGILTSRAFLRHALNRLTDLRLAGTGSTLKNATWRASSFVPDSLYLGPNASTPIGPDIMEAEAKVSYRYSDVYAFLLSWGADGPPFRLYWPEAKRDAALKQYQIWLTAKLSATPEPK